MSATAPAVQRRGTLGEALAEEVRARADDVAAHDGTAALSEAFLLGLERPGDHRLLLGDGGVLGYAQVGDDDAVESFVVPGRRREGLGGRLVDDVLATHPQSRWWAHGDLPAARALAQARGAEIVRELLVLRRPLRAEDAGDVALPEGYRARAFVPGRDEAALLALNAAAFADHPEQGRLDQAGLRERMAQPWFDPAGLLLLVEESDAAGGPRLRAFHWTKVAPTAPGAHPIGEVYVVGVHPEAQGRGLGRPVTRLGLAHLARQGLPAVELYVEGDNAPALATYTREGFTRAQAHVMHSLPVHR